MPNNRRHIDQAQSETPAENIAATSQEGGSGSAEGQAQGHGETAAPAAAAEDAGQEEQAAAESRNAMETAVEGMGGGGDNTEEQTATEVPTPTGEPQSGLPMTVRLHTGIPMEDVVATADVTLGGICTIRNVKIKEDDYGLKVVMPRTRMPDTGRFRDACYFHTPELREQFDAAVKDAYRQALEPIQTQGGMDGMTM